MEVELKETCEDEKLEKENGHAKEIAVTVVGAMKRTGSDFDVDEEENESLPAKAKKKRGKKKKKKKDKSKNSLLENKVQPPGDKPYLALLLDKFFGPRGERPMASRLKMSDVQDLILYAVMRNSLYFPPHWCYLGLPQKLKKTVIILLSSVGENDFKKHEDSFPSIKKELSLVVPTKASGSEFGFEFPHETLLACPLSKSEKRKRNYTKKLEQEKQVLSHDREHFMLSKEQLAANKYPQMCYDTAPDTCSSDFLPCVTKDKPTHESTGPSPMFAVDCEMCDSSEGKELTRVSVVDESFNVVYDTFVKPDRPIINYKTQYSGITAQTLEGVTIRLEDVQHELQRILPYDAILIGHSFDCDFNALQMYHDRVIDTSVIYGDKRGSNFKSALKYLAQLYLKKTIQTGCDGHCSIQDAKTCMELVKLKIEKGPLFGIPTTVSEGLFEVLTRGRKQGAIIDLPGIVRNHSTGSHHVIPCTSDNELLWFFGEQERFKRKFACSICRTVYEYAYKKLISTSIPILSRAAKLIEKSDFTWIHFHGVEIFNKENNAKTNEDLAERTKHFEEELRKLDAGVASIHQAMPEDCLLVVLMACGDVTEVIRLQKESSPMTKELKEAAIEAKKGLCFMKIT